MDVPPKHYSMPQTAESFFSHLAVVGQRNTLYSVTPEFWQAFANTVKFDEIKPWLDTLTLDEPLQTKTKRAVLIAHLYLRAQGIARQRPSVGLITEQVNNLLGTRNLTECNANRMLDHLGIRNRKSKTPPAVKRQRNLSPDKRVRSRYSVLKIEPQLAAVARLAEAGLAPERIVDCLNFVKTEIKDQAPLYAADMLTQETRPPLVGEQLLRHAFRRGQNVATATGVIAGPR